MLTKGFTPCCAEQESWSADRPPGTGTPSPASGGAFTDLGFDEAVVPAIWGASTFLDKLGPEKESQMWTFGDKAGRACCLVPEVTGLIQETWRDDWSRRAKGPMRLFYEARCYRYERPQAGRYREFTQFGVEILGGAAPDDAEEARSALEACLSLFPGRFEFRPAVARGLAYYVGDGFEVECPDLGAQRQVAGGGRYAEGIGWAIGVERVLLAGEAG